MKLSPARSTGEGHRIITIPGIGSLRREVLIVAVVLAALLIFGGTRLFHSGPSVSQVASAAGAVSCSDSGYSLESQITGRKQEIYNCTFAPAGERCVSYNSGVANDVTAEAKLVFANSFSDGPSCLHG